MVCYGGTCGPTCPMFDIHHPRLLTCEACKETFLSWYLKDGCCPQCGHPYEDKTKDAQEREEA